MRASRLTVDSDVAEAASDRVIRLRSLMALPVDEVAMARSNVAKKLTDQPHLGEDELVIIGLKYLHREVGLRHHAGSARTGSSEKNS